jgi:tetratricopeptide (TPR) repeat protein
MDRRYFFTSLLIGFGIFHNVAQASSTRIVTANQKEKEEGRQAYQNAMIFLRRGVRYEQVVKNLKIAVAADQKNYRYLLALGCAYLGRFDSVAKAMNLQKADERNKSKYYARRKLWEEAQLDRTNPLFGVAPPSAPPVRMTSDDKQPFQMTESEALKYLVVLVSQLLGAWERAKENASSPAEKIETLSVYGCGLSMLRTRLYGVSFDVSDREYEMFNDTLMSSKERDVFKELVFISPDKYLSWNWLGNAFYSRYLRLKDNNDVSECVNCYEKSLALNPNQNILALRLYKIKKFMQGDSSQRSEFIKPLEYAINNKGHFADCRIVWFCEHLIIAGENFKDNNFESRKIFKDAYSKFKRYPLVVKMPEDDFDFPEVLRGVYGARKSYQTLERLLLESHFIAKLKQSAFALSENFISDGFASSSLDIGNAIVLIVFFYIDLIKSDDSIYTNVLFSGVLSMVVSLAEAGVEIRKNSVRDENEMLYKEVASDNLSVQRAVEDLRKEASLKRDKFVKGYLEDYEPVM